MSFDSWAYLIFVVLFAVFGVAIVVAVLRWAFRINDSIALMQAILAELRSQKTTPDA